MRPPFAGAPRPTPAAQPDAPVNGARETATSDRPRAQAAPVPMKGARP
jgi:hypothetical protein